MKTERERERERERETDRQTDRENPFIRAPDKLHAVNKTFMKLYGDVALRSAEYSVSQAADAQFSVLHEAIDKNKVFRYRKQIARHHLSRSSGMQRKNWLLRPVPRLKVHDVDYIQHYNAVNYNAVNSVKCVQIYTFILEGLHSKL